MDALPPPTTLLVPDSHKRRFESITSPCEYVEDYQPGGYHPTHLGDSFKNGQYKVMRKLGEGFFSTVWLARNTNNGTYVALKIMVSEISDPIRELEMLHHVRQVGAARGVQHVTQLLDEFKHHGPNGIHSCLVFEPMGPSVNSMVEELPQFKPRMFGMKALAFLHDQGIAHGDFQPGNMLFCLNSIESEPEDALRQQIDVEFESISPPVKRLDGKEDQCAPRYLCIAQPLMPFTNYGQGFKIKLSDLGGAYFFTDPLAKAVTPCGLRAPETVLTGTLGRTSDVWAFGCLVFELITGRPLFCVPASRFQDDELLLDFSTQLGMLPDELFKQWNTSSRYFTTEKKLFNCNLGGVPEGEEQLMLELSSIEEMFDQADVGLSTEEACSVKTLVRRILQYDPKERPSVDELLQDPFFR